LVKRALAMESPPSGQRSVSQASILDPYKSQIDTILARYPNLSAVRVREKIAAPQNGLPGYTGGVTLVRDYLRSVRPARGRVYQDVFYSPGEAIQIDWGDCGTLKIGTTTRRVSVFVAVLCYSRMCFIEFTLSQRKAEFYRALVHALEFFGGTPRKVVFDNLKAAVLSGSGRTARLHPEFEAMCGHYYLEPVACESYDPESKGMVEAKVGYVKRNAFQGRDDELENWDGYERLATSWRDDVANVRLHDRLGQNGIAKFVWCPCIGYRQ
jgi:transposase